VTARVLPFPATPILRAVQHLQRPVSSEAERLAASILIEALTQGEPVPPGTLGLVCSTLVKHARGAFGVRLAEKLAELDDNIEVLILGQVLLDEPATRAAGLALLRRLG
jgi:hypothetical protein